MKNDSYDVSGRGGAARRVRRAVPVFASFALCLAPRAMGQPVSTSLVAHVLNDKNITASTSDDGDRWFVGAADGTLAVIDLGVPEIARQARTESRDEIVAIGVDASGDVVIAADDSGRLYRWSWVSDEPAVLRDRRLRDLSAMAMSRDGTMVAVAGRDFIELVDVATGISRGQMRHDGDVMFVDFIGGDRLVSVSKDGTTLWDTRTKSRLRNQDRDTEILSSVTAVDHSAEGFLAVAGGRRTNVSRSTAALDRRGSSGGGGGELGTSLAQYDDRILLMSTKDGLNVTVLGSVELEREVVALAIQPDNSYVAASSRRGPVLIWDVRSGRLQGREEISDVNELRFSKDGQWLVAATDDGLRAWALVGRRTETSNIEVLSDRRCTPGERGDTILTIESDVVVGFVGFESAAVDEEIASAASRLMIEQLGFYSRVRVVDRTIRAEIIREQERQLDPGATDEQTQVETGLGLNPDVLLQGEFRRENSARMLSMTLLNVETERALVRTVNCPVWDDDDLPNAIRALADAAIAIP